jgi:Ran GTPase-activating protein (RanGAP) involved in mRNA processing and transport
MVVEFLQEQSEQLILTRKGYGNKEAELIGRFLSFSSTLTSLDLSRNYIEDQGIQHLVSGLQTNSSLVCLNLSSNFISNQGIKYLSDIFRTTLKPNLRTLDLSSNHFDEEGIHELTTALSLNSTLTELNLNWNSFGSKGAQYLGDLLRHSSTLKTLHLRGTGIGITGTQRITEALQTGKSPLTSLDLGANNIEDLGAFHIAEMLSSNNTLTSLDLGDSQIKDQGIEYIVRSLQYYNTSLLELNLEDEFKEIQIPSEIQVYLNRNTWNLKMKTKSLFIKLLEDSWNFKTTSMKILKMPIYS